MFVFLQVLPRNNTSLFSPNIPELRLWLQITGCSLYCISQIARENYELQSQVDLYYYVLLSVCGFVVIDRAVVYKKRVTWGLFAFQKIGEGIIKF